jgi:CRP/FNR family transcriptional regulator, cyclic AMP receptor protein
MNGRTSVAKKQDFHPGILLASIGKGGSTREFVKGEKIYSQGGISDGLFYIQLGRVQLSVVSQSGKEAILGVFGEGDFFGEGSLTGQVIRMSTATAMTDCTVLFIEYEAMKRAMGQNPKLSATFVEYLLRRNIRYQEDLIDQLFNSSEKRLARVLLLMANFGEQGGFDISVPRVSQEVLAETVGTTRSRINFFMNRFRKLGFIDYKVGNTIRVHSSLLGIVLNDDSGSAKASKGRKPDSAGGSPRTSGGPTEKERARKPPLRKL